MRLRLPVPSVLSVLLVLFVLSLPSSPLPAATLDLTTASAADLQAAFASGSLTSEKLVSLYLARITAYDTAGPKLASFLTLNPRAADEARALDAERKAGKVRGPLHGVPVVFKDLIDIAGLPTTMGHAPFGAPVPSRDATLVTRLRAAGCVMLAKVSTRNWFGSDEQHPIGYTLNPYKPGYSPGFTSNGPGAAIACYFSTLAIGTDNSASVQHPAANCSVVGMVATQGMISRAGIMTNSATQDRPGPMAQSVYDVAALVSVLAGWDAEDFMTFRAMGYFPGHDWSKDLKPGALKGKRIGVLREMIYDGPAHAEAKAVYQQALDDMRQAGAFIVDPVLTGIDLKNQTQSAFISPASYEQRAHQNVYLARLGSATKWKNVEEMIAATVTSARGSRNLPPPDQSDDALARYRARDAMIKLIHDTMDRYSLDAIALPYRTIPPEPYPGPRPPESSTNLTSCTGLPAIIVPGGYIPDGRPIGIQILGREHSEPMLLQVAYGYEQASQRRKIPALTPPLPGESFTY